MSIKKKIPLMNQKRLDTETRLKSICNKKRKLIKKDSMCTVSLMSDTINSFSITATQILIAHFQYTVVSIVTPN